MSSKNKRKNIYKQLIAFRNELQELIYLQNKFQRKFTKIDVMDLFNEINNYLFKQPKHGPMLIKNLYTEDQERNINTEKRTTYSGISNLEAKIALINNILKKEV